MRLLTLAILSLSLLTLSACQHDAPSPPVAIPAQATATQGGARSPPSTPPMSDVSDPDQRVYKDAIFEVDRVPGGKRFQGSWLLLGSGERLLLSYRPLPGYFHLLGKRVIATGRHKTHAPHEQQIGADHFELSSMEAAPGEAPITPKPVQLPSPPHVKTRAEFRAHFGRWVRIHPTFTGLATPQEDSRWLRLGLKLEDGSALEVHTSTSDYEKSWRPLAGKQLTLLGEASSDWQQQAQQQRGALLLSDPPPTLEELAKQLDDAPTSAPAARPPETLIILARTPCEGIVERCGMLDKE